MIVGENMKLTKRIVFILFSIVLINIFICIKQDQKFKYLDTKQMKIYNLYKDDLVPSLNSKNIQESTDMKIMSFNIHKGRNEKNKYTLDSTIKLIKENNADIVCLQEVLGFQDAKIKKHLENNSQFIVNQRDNLFSHGLAIYSKYPIVESNQILLTSNGEQRGLLHVTFYINNKYVNVINAHLAINTDERKVQIEEMMNYINGLDGEVILAGDFNQTNLELNKLVDVGKYHGYVNSKTFIPIDSRIDHIFIKKGEIYSSTYNIIDSKLSDHYPITANIKYKPQLILD